MEIIKDTTAALTGVLPVDEQIYVYDSIKLGDDMASIGKILFYDTAVVIEEVKNIHSSYNVKGSVFVSLTYESESKTAESLSGKIAFEYAAESLSDNDEYLFRTNVKTCELTPIRKRRVDINISLGLNGYILKKEKLEYTKGFTAGEAECRKTRFRAGEIISKKVFVPLEFISEDIELEETKLMCCAVSLQETSSTASSAGIMLSATLSAQALVEGYSDDVSSFRCLSLTETAANVFEVNSTLEYDEYTTFAKAVITDAELIPSETGAKLCIKALAVFDVFFVRAACYESVSEMYSLSSNSVCEYEEKKSFCPDWCERVGLEVTSKAKLDARAVFYKPVFTSSDISFSLNNTRNFAKVTGELALRFTVLESLDGKYELIETKIPFEYEKQFEGEAERDIFVNATVENITSSAENGALTVCGKVTLMIMSVSFEELSVISTVREESAEETSGDIKISVIYYSGEDALWQAGRKNRVAVKKILTDNSYDDVSDLTDGTPLIIKKD